MKYAALVVTAGLSFGLSPAAKAHHQGTCYVSKNKTHICYVRTGKQSFAAAVTDGKSVNPTVLAFDCAGQWWGAGALPKDSMTLITRAICSDHGLPKSAVLTASY